MSLRRIASFVVVLALALFAVVKAPASELDKKLSVLARQIAKLVKDNDQTAVAVGDFTSPPAFESSPGPGIQLRLISELKKNNIDINKDAFLVIKGEYLLPDVKDREDELIVRLVLIVRDKQGKLVREFQEDIDSRFGNGDIPGILGANFDNAANVNATDGDINRRMKAQVKKQPLNIKGTKVQTTKDSSFAVEMLVKPKGGDAFKVVNPVDLDGKGMAFVELKRGDQYTLRLHNTSQIEAAAFITIDAVDALQFFEPGEGRPTSFLIAPGSVREVEGWHRDYKKLNRFLIGAYSDSANAKFLRNPSVVGTITVCFHHCWQKDKKPASYADARSFKDNATGFGEEKKVETKSVNRTLGPFLAAITIRYNNK